MFSPEEIDKIRFTRTAYGYSPREADEFLAHIKREMAELCRENASLRTALGDARYESAKLRLEVGRLTKELDMFREGVGVTADEIADISLFGENETVGDNDTETSPADAAEDIAEMAAVLSDPADPEDIAGNADEAGDDDETASPEEPDDEYGEDETPSSESMTEDDKPLAEEEQTSEYDELYELLDPDDLDDYDEPDALELLGANIMSGGAEDYSELVADLENMFGVNNGSVTDEPSPAEETEEKNVEIPDFDGSFRSGAETGDEAPDLRDRYETGTSAGELERSYTAPESGQETVKTPVHKGKKYRIKKKTAPKKTDIPDATQKDDEDADILAALKTEYDTFNYFFGDGKK